MLKLNRLEKLTDQQYYKTKHYMFVQIVKKWATTVKLVQHPSHSTVAYITYVYMNIIYY